MNLNFKTHFPWPGADRRPEPTYFQEQILNGLHPERVATAFDEFLPEPKPVAYKVLMKGQLNPKLDGVHELVRGKKLHSIRRINHGKPRFREGMKLTFSTGSRFKPERFGETTCTGIQIINMELREGSSFVDLMPYLILPAAIPHLIMGDQMEQLAANDGLSSFDFKKWFTLELLLRGPGTFEVVHWTDLRY